MLYIISLVTYKHCFYKERKGCNMKSLKLTNLGRSTTEISITLNTSAFPEKFVDYILCFIDFNKNSYEFSFHETGSPSNRLLYFPRDSHLKSFYIKLLKGLYYHITGTEPGNLREQFLAKDTEEKKGNPLIITFESKYDGVSYIKYDTSGFSSYLPFIKNGLSKELNADDFYEPLPNFDDSKIELNFKNLEKLMALNLFIAESL